MNDSRLRIALIFALAVALTAAIFVGSGALSRYDFGEGPAQGKLSMDIANYETKFKEARALWQANEKAIYAFEASSFPVLAQVDTQFKDLAAGADKLKGVTDAERAALPYLVEAAKQSAQVPPIFLMRQVNPKSVSDQKLREAKQSAIKANEAWNSWQNATAGLSR